MFQVRTNVKKLRGSVNHPKDRNKQKRPNGLFPFISGKFLNLVMLIIIFVGIVSSYYIFSNNLHFQKYLDSAISFLGEGECVRYSPSIVYSFLVVEYRDNEVGKVYLNTFGEGRRFNLDISEHVFQINNGGMKGTVSEFVKSNSYYLQKNKILLNLKNHFYRDLLLKIDSLIVVENIEHLQQYVNFYSMSFWNRLFIEKKSLHNFVILTDLCVGDFRRLIEDYFSDSRLKSSEFSMTGSIIMKDLFPFDDLRKEQVRIQVINATGVDHWGYSIKDIFQSYGLNVIKVENDVSVRGHTEISIDREEIRNSNTVKQIQYLLGRDGSQKSIKKEDTIFADIYVKLGLDSLVN